MGRSNVEDVSETEATASTLGARSRGPEANGFSIFGLSARNQVGRRRISPNPNIRSPDLDTVDPTRSSGGLLTCAPDREESISAQSLVHSSTMPYYSQGANSMSPCTFATGTPCRQNDWKPTENHRSTAQWLSDLTITATEQANSTPQPYASIPDAEFFASDYNSIYISAPVYTSFNPQLDDSGIAPTPWRSTTPFSQASEDSSTCYTTTNPGHLDPGLAWRSNTPFSQASEEAPIDGLLDPYVVAS